MGIFDKLYDCREASVIFLQFIENCNLAVNYIGLNGPKPRQTLYHQGHRSTYYFLIGPTSPISWTPRPTTPDVH